MATDDLAQLNVLFNTPVGTQENVLGFRAKTNTATLAGLAAEFDGARLTDWIATMANAWSVSLLTVEDIRPGTHATVLHAVSPAKANTTGTGEVLPPQDSAVISWRTDTKGRSFRGRSYHPGHLESQQASGVWTSSTLVALNAMADNFLARYGPSGTYTDWQFVIISLSSGGVRRLNPVSTAVTAFAVSPFVFTQRRRGAGVK